MKRTIFFIIALTTLLFSSVFAVAAEKELDTYGDEIEDKLYSIIDSDTRKALEGIGIDSFDLTGIYDVSLKSITRFYSDDLKTQIKQTAKTFFMLLSVVIIISSLTVLIDKNSDVVSLISVSAATLLSVGSVSPIISAAVSAMNVSAAFMKSYIPIYAGIIAFSGNPGTALSYNTIVLGAAEVISAFVNDFAVSLLGMFFCMVIVFSLSETVNTARFINASNKVINVFLGFASTLFTGLLSLKSVLSSSVDAAALKSVRFLLSSLIPVVGSAISEAYSSLLGSINLIKGSVAVVGIAVILVLTIPIALQAFMSYISFSLLSSVSEILDSMRLSVLFRGFASGIKYLLLFSVFEAFVLIISTGIVLLVKNG